VENVSNITFEGKNNSRPVSILNFFPRTTPTNPNTHTIVQFPGFHYSVSEGGLGGEGTAPHKN
jgi:hypothetical protein